MAIGDLVLVKFPFTNLNTEKKRPALVLAEVPFAKSLDLLVVALVTSKLDGLKLRGDVRLKDWEGANLLHASLVRLSKIATLEAELIDKKIGSLSSADRKTVKAVFQDIFSPWVG